MRTCTPLTPFLYLGNGWTDYDNIWHVASDQLVMWLQHAHGVSLCTWARAHLASISWERLNWLCSNLLHEQRPIWYVASTKQWGCQCTCACAHSTSFLGILLELGDSRLMIVEFLEISFSRHDTCKLLCVTSLALARSSPTRRYTGIKHSCYHPLFFSRRKADIQTKSFIFRYAHL